MDELEFVKEISVEGKKTQEVVDDFLHKIGGITNNYVDFEYQGERWLINYQPFHYSDDIIIEEKEIKDYKYFLLVKQSENRTRIVGYCDKKLLISVSARDIYRNGINCYMVVDSNVKDLSFFKIKKAQELKKDFIINQQTADNLGHTEMISGILAGLHFFAKKGKVFFRDINQTDECQLGELKTKIYTRDAIMDEDMLIHESYFKSHPKIDIFILCKKKGGEYKYLGYITRAVVEQTRVIQMIGEDSIQASQDIRRIFAEQYLPITDLIKIYEEKKEEQKVAKVQNYIPLNIHSEYSIGEAYGVIPYIVETSYKKGFKAAALTDLSTMAGLWIFQKAMLEKKLKPILGQQVYVIMPEDDRRFELVLLIKNEQGWKNLLKLQALAVREHFYYKPRIPIEKLLEYSEGLICICSGKNSPLFSFINKGKKNEARDFLILLQQHFKQNLYCQINTQRLNGYQLAMKSIYSLADELNIKCVFSSCVYYPNKEDQYIHDAVLAIHKKKKYGEVSLEENESFIMQDEDIIVDGELLWMQQFIDNWKRNTFEVEEKCNFIIKPPKENDTLPKFLPSKEERKNKLMELTLQGLEKYTKYKYDGIAKDRIDLELDRMITKDYENYFLIVWDLVKWAKESGIRVGCGRGSVGASLVAFALNITECDPLEYDLFFDRFLSEIRKDAPDADLDFMDSRRGEIFTYMQNKYGINHTAKIVTYARFHPKGILRDIGRIFDIPNQEINKICNLCLQRSGGDARVSFALADTFAEFQEAKEFQQKYPQAVDIALKLESHIRHKGIHAAAVVLAEQEIEYYLPINKVNGEIVTEWEKQLVEDMKIVKFDILGLKTLTVIDDAVKMAECKLPKNFNDENIYKNIFQNGNTLGVFQFEQVGMTKLATSIGIKNFNELYDATSLYRPGSLHCVDKDTLIKTKNGYIKIQKLFALQYYNKKVPLIFNGVGKLEQSEKIHYNGEQECYKMTLDCSAGNAKENYNIFCTKDHRFLFSDENWKKLEELKIGDEILVEKLQKGFGAKFNSCKKDAKKEKIPFDPIQIKRIAKNRIDSGAKTRFKKGAIPHNKGKIGWGTAMWKKYPEKHPNFILNKNGRISYQQKKLFEIVKEKFPSAQLNYSIRLSDSYRFCDVAVPELKIDFEYDGEYWHKNKAYDDERDRKMASAGWKTIRVNKNNFSAFKELIKSEF